MPDDDLFEQDLQAAVADLGRLVTHLARLSPRSWRDRREPVDSLLAAMVALCEQQQGRSLTPPDLADHVLPDALTVIGGEVLDELARATDRAVLDSVRSGLAEALDATR